MRISGIIFVISYVFLVILRENVVDSTRDISQSVPNAKKVTVNGRSVFGLGHPNIIVRSTVESKGNPFGKDAFPNRFNLNGLWPAICGIDSDLDGDSNGVELCDPLCQWQKGDPDPICDSTQGQVLSHPGFPPGVIGESPPYIKAHGALMIIAWLFLAPFGILMALIYKKGKSPLWFNVHRACLASAALLTVLAFFIMWAVQGFNISTKHPKLGFTVVILAVAQVISGIMRPHNPKNARYVAKTNTRLLWEFQHQWTGRIAMILAISSIVTGLELGFGVIDEVEAGNKFILSLFLIVGIGCFMYVFLVREKNAPVKQLDFKEGRVSEKVRDQSMSRLSQKLQQEITYENKNQKKRYTPSFGTKAAAKMEVPEAEVVDDLNVLSPSTSYSSRKASQTKVTMAKPNISMKSSKSNKFNILEEQVKEIPELPQNKSSFASFGSKKSNFSKKSAKLSKAEEELLAPTNWSKENLSNKPEENDEEEPERNSETEIEVEETVEAKKPKTRDFNDFEV